MATKVADKREFFVLGKKEHNNRSLYVVKTGEEYSVEATSVQYTDARASFPYTA